MGEGKWCTGEESINAFRKPERVEMCPAESLKESFAVTLVKN